MSEDPRLGALRGRLRAVGADEQRVAEWIDRLLRGDEDIREAALQWAATGQMPAEPTILGHGPRLLAADRPAQHVFPLLQFMRDDPVRAKRVLSRGPDLDLESTPGS